MLQRPEGADVLVRLSAHVEARPRPVFDSLAEHLHPGKGASSGFLADTARTLVITQSGYWYRAEYQVVPDEHGSHIDHTLLNIAPHLRGVSRTLARRTIASAPVDFERLITLIRADVE